MFEIELFDHLTACKYICREAVGVFYSPSRLSKQSTRWGGVLPLYREAVGVFYSPSPLVNKKK